MNDDLSMVLDCIGPADRIALFDLDSALLEEPFLHRLARHADLTREMDSFLLNTPRALEAHTTAKIFSGQEREIFEEAARGIPLMRGANATVLGLKRAGFRVGVITDGFALAAEEVRGRIGADFSVGHALHFQHDRATGECTPCAALQHGRGCRRHSLCKMNLLVHLRERCCPEPTQVLAVANGDRDRDLCLLCASDFAIGVRPSNRHVNAASAHPIFNSLTEILELVLDPEEETLVTSEFSPGGWQAASTAAP